MPLQNRSSAPYEQTESADFRWVTLVVSLGFLGWFGCATDQALIWPKDQNEAFLRLAATILIACGTLALFTKIWLWSSASGPQWWRFSNRLSKPSWADVRRMTLGEGRDDPIRFPKGRLSLWRQIRACFGYIVSGSLAIEALSVVFAGPILPQLLKDKQIEAKQLEGFRTVSLELSANLTAFLALFAAAVSIYFTHRQLQAKVKADSRQAWIDKLRTHIAHFIASADPDLFNGVGGMERRKTHHDLNARRLELELMLNPSEKDHRLLSYLAMKLAFFDSGQDRFKQIQDYRNLAREIVRSEDYRANRNQWKKLIGPIPDADFEIEGEVDRAYSDLVGYAIRLAHVVLKREWERVKSTR